MSEIRSIFPPHEAFYIRSMLFNAQAASRSIEVGNALMHEISANNPENPTSSLLVYRFLGELQNFVVHAAALSRYFWPVRVAHKWRGEQLRRSFALTEQSPLRFSKELRDTIEHFDERLDGFLEGNIVGEVLPEYVGPFYETDVEVHRLRAYFLDKGDFEFLGNRCNILALSREVQRLYLALLRLDETGGRLSQPDA